MIATASLLASAALTVFLQGPAPDRPAPTPTPTDSATFEVGGKPVTIRYTRRPPSEYPSPMQQGPTLGGLAMIGGVAYGELWLDEPMTLVTPVALSVAGLDVPPGTYTLYALPGETEWTIVVARSLSVKGEPMDGYSVMHADLVGSVTAERGWTPQPIDTFTVRPDPATAEAKAIIFEWDRTRVRVPVGPGGKREPDEPFHYCVRRGLQLFLTPPVGPCHPIRKSAPASSGKPVSRAAKPGPSPSPARRAP